MENTTIRVGKLTFRRKSDARPVSVIQGMESISYVCITPDFGRFIIRDPFTPEKVLDHQNYNEYLNSLGSVIDKNLNTVLDEAPEELGLEPSSNEESGDYRISKSLDYLPDKDDGFVLADSDIRYYLERKKKGKITPGEFEDEYKELKKKVWEFYEAKIKRLSNTDFFRELFGKLRERWELTTYSNNFELLREPLTKIVCLDNWEIINEEFLEDFRSYLKYAKLAPLAAPDFYLGLAVLLFDDYLDLTRGDAHFIPLFPQVLILQSGNTKRIFVEVFPETDAKNMSTIFNLIKLIRTLEVGESLQRTESKETDYPDELKEEWERMHHKMSWDKIADLFNEKCGNDRFQGPNIKQIVYRYRKKKKSVTQ